MDREPVAWKEIIVYWSSNDKSIQQILENTQGLWVYEIHTWNELLYI